VNPLVNRTDPAKSSQVAIQDRTGQGKSTLVEIGQKSIGIWDATEWDAEEKMLEKRGRYRKEVYKHWRKDPRELFPNGSSRY
jgi:hypothetical protein